MRSKLSLLLKFLGLFTIGIILLVGPEFLDDKSKQAVTDWLGEGYRWIIIGAICTAFLFHLLWTEGASFFGPANDKLPPEQILEAEIENTRKSLLQSYQARHDAKLAARYPINLQIQYSTEGTSEEKQVLLDNRTLDGRLVKGSILEIFDRFRGRLLIIGEPGAGKTTLLLELAEALLEREAGTLPIVINMITWRDRFRSVEEWLTELLPQIGFSKRLAGVLVRGKRILPLFDGLDEVAEDGRASCLAAITQYGVANEARFVICSRIAEYASTADAPVRGQVKIRPLSREQIIAQLKTLEVPESSGLLDAIKKDPLFAAAIESPVYLNTAQLLFAFHKTWDDFGFAATTVEERRNEIRQQFVHQLLNSAPYQKQDAVRWLCFLSDRMTQNRLIQFELSDLQYDWSRWTRLPLFVGRFLQGVVSALDTGIIVVLFTTSLFALLAGAMTMRYRATIAVPFVLVSLAMLLGMILVLGVVNGLVKALSEIHKNSSPTVETKDRSFLSIQHYFVFAINELRYPLLILVSLFGICLALDFELSEGVIFAAIGSLMFPLTKAFIMNRDKSPYTYLRPTSPYQRFTGSMRLFYFSIIQHFHLRHLLYRKGLLPWRLVNFLNSMTAHHLLESDGATWRFRHQIFMDYFLEHYREEAGHKVARKE